MAFPVPPAVRMRLRGTWVARVYAQGHAALYALTAGRIGAAIHVAAGAPPPVLLLVTTGRRTGKARTSPLIYLIDGLNDEGDFVVAAANAGHPQHPAWWLNLLAEPHATVQVGGTSHAVVASEVDGSRRAALWDRFVAMYGGLADYQRQSARRIPIIALTPVRTGPQ